ncbi:MAG: eukaryotic-like serine/threonine-protein kinase [Thermoanaerobaculia bacterium]|jgi:HAMP domain-containing protein|nr:eukaryotic-like serine/threonine-protein kinase [Thermoanaerobaculia bacterium]
MIAPYVNASSPDGNTETVDPLEEVRSAFEPFPAGTLIAGRYEITRLLGRGGYSAVYCARDRELKRDIALKIIRPERLSSTTELRLRREVNIARAAHSPHLVRVFDLGTDGATIFLTMELVDGESLRQKLALEQRLDFREAIGIAGQMFRGLEALHLLKSIHRDIKPENVLIAADGTVKLADFGLARGLDDEQSRATMAGSVIGTADYLSPEQALGHPLDERTDLYSAGVVLFEMLTGELPFVRESSLGSMIARIGKPARAVRSLRSDVPYWLATVVARLLDRDPARRYRSAREVITALEGRRADLRAWVPRGRTWVAALLVLGAVIAAARFGVNRSQRRFARLASNGDRGIVAIGRNGETLWRRDGVDPDIAERYALVRGHLDEPPLLATVLTRRSEIALPNVLLLSFLDTENGRLVRQVHLPDDSQSFPNDSRRYRPFNISSADVDSDGIDEVFIDYIQVPEAPSFTIMYEPLADRSRILFRAVGHHVFAGLHDVDGDGRQDALFIGINNAFDWINTLAAVRISPWIGDIATQPEVTASPDMADRPDYETNMLWYTLLPRLTFPHRATASLSFDDRGRRIAIKTPGRLIGVTMDGFLTGENSLLPSVQRNAHRHLAYVSYREAERLSAVGATGEALGEMKKSIAEALLANETILVEVMQRADAALLIRSGQIAEGEGLFQTLWQRSENASEIAYEAGVAYHLHGDLDRAFVWYERGLGRGARMGAGKGKHEFEQGILFVVTEGHRWAEATTAIERYRTAYPTNENDARIYDEYVRWRRGEIPRIDEIHVDWGSTDINRYWLLEFRLARGESPAVLLPSVESEVNIRSQPQCVWRSLRAELMWRMRRRPEASTEASRARDALITERNSSIIARAHADIIQERYARIAGGKGG